MIIYFFYIQMLSLYLIIMTLSQNVNINLIISIVYQEFQFFYPLTFYFIITTLYHMV